MTQQEQVLDMGAAALEERAVADGGFVQRPGAAVRPDATAWAALALTASRRRPDLVEGACRRLARSQLPDGRVPVGVGFAEAWWPTPLAVLAWNAAGGFAQPMQTAVQFLLDTSGLHLRREPNSPSGHDTAIRGWSWIEHTHSWIEPTCMAILALKSAGHGGHDRVREAVRMILDRQLSGGGWNYGNTTVFDRELLPMPEHTGHALCALAGSVPAADLERSIAYLRSVLPALQTPFSLCWTWYGLSAWSVPLEDVTPRVERCLKLQDKYGAYDTTVLSQLMLACTAGGRLTASAAAR